MLRAGAGVLGRKLERICLLNERIVRYIVLFPSKMRGLISQAYFSLYFSVEVISQEFFVSFFSRNEAHSGDYVTSVG